MLFIFPYNVICVFEFLTNFRLKEEKKMKE